MRDALGRLGSRRPEQLAAPAREWLRRWSGLILAWTAAGRWSRKERRALLQLAVAKAGRTERQFHRQLLRHERLRTLLGC